MRDHLGVLRLSPEREIEIVEEQALHLEAAYEDALADGLSEEEAEARAVRSYDWRLLECELSRAEQPLAARTLQPSMELIERKGGIRMGSFIQDLRFGVRMLLKQPGFTLIAVVTLALGIGANTAIFSVVSAVLLRPLPYPEPEQLARLLNMDMTSGARDIGASMPDYREWRKRNQSFAHLAAYRTSTYNISGDEEPERVVGARVDTDFFPLLGVNPAQGRGFSGEEGVFGNHRVVVLSDALWRRRFGDATRLDGQTIRLNGESFAVVGVAPRGFRFPSNDVALWTPLALADNDPLNSRGDFWLSVIGRLKPGVNPAQAQNDLVNIHRQLEQKYTSDFYGRVETLAEATVVDVRRTLLVLLSAVGCVLLIACVNVANLLLARASARASEIAVRATLGAGRGRLVRQMLTESLLIGLLGAIAGLALASLGVDALVKLETNLPRFDTVRVDGRALGFTLGLALGASLLFGLIPALRSAGSDLSADIKGGGRGGTRDHRLLGGMVVAEIAIALVLLAGAGLMINSLLRLQRVELGYETKNILTMQLALPAAKYPDSQREQAVAFYRQLVERVKALPGVQNAGVTTALPLAGGGLEKLFTREDRPAPKALNEISVTEYRHVSADYFETLGIRLVNGRYLNERDAPNGLPVAVINEMAANRFWPGENPIGKVFKLGPPEEMLPAGILPPGYRFIRWTVVGVLKDVKHQGLSQPSSPEIYTLPQQGLSNAGATRMMYLAVRASSDPTALTAAIRRQAQELDKEQPIADVATMEERHADSLLRARFNTLLLAIFAAVALILAVVGVYGVMSYSVAERTREIGIRVALGAQRRDVIGLIVKRGMALALGGALIGLCGAIALTRLMTGMLYEVSATDPLTLSAVAGVLAAAAALACYLPARRATKVDPLTALRHD